MLKKDIDKIYASINKYEWKPSFKYVIVTSMNLTPKRLKTVRDYANEKIPDAMPSDDYIIFSSALTSLSQDTNFKKIFESYGLIEKDFSKILKKQKIDNIEPESNDYFSESGFEYFVETDFLGEAYEILQNEHILLIQGPPGIGKTTTCAMLANLFSINNENNFNIIVRKVEDIDKVLEIYNGTYRKTDKNLFVVFDDFLGRNSFDTGERVLQDIKKLYSASKNSNNLFVCLNSRTQILKTAQEINFEFKKLVDEKFTNGKNFIIDLSKYTDIDRAHIFRESFKRKKSLIDEKDKINLEEKYGQLMGKDWKLIINHKNYSPRLIELIVTNFKNSDEDFFNYIVRFLDHPSNLYDNLFNNLEEEEKYLLFSLLLFDKYPIYEDWLINSFNNLKINTTFDLKKSLNKLEDSWLSFSKETFDSPRKVDFFNPSIIDFLNDKIKWFDNMKSEIINCSIYLHQLQIKNIIYSSDPLPLEETFLIRIIENWSTFKDNFEFIGEKVIGIIRLNLYETYKIDFNKILNTYEGELTSSPYSCGWERIISNIWYSDDYNLKKDFLMSLEDDAIVENILNSYNINSEEFDNILGYINEIIGDLSDIDERYYEVFFEGSAFYSKFRDKKIELIQDFLNDENSLDEVEIIFPQDPDDFDLDIEIDGQMYLIKDEITKMIKNKYEWKDIDTESLVFSDFKYNLNDYIQREFDNLYIENNTNGKTNVSQSNNEETIETILNKPL